jgi:hypothetical protein
MLLPWGWGRSFKQLLHDITLQVLFYSDKRRKSHAKM